MAHDTTETALDLAQASDRDLFLALQAGDARALGCLYDRYASLVYRLALRLLTNAQEAEDLTQDVFLYLWRRQTYNPDRGSLGSFLTTLTRSRAIDRLRSRSSKFRFLQRWSRSMKTETTAPTPFDVASVAQRSERVREALEALPERYRQVLELAYYEGLSQSEIAAQLDIPLGTVKTWSRQGLLTLRQNLQPWME